MRELTELADKIVRVQLERSTGVGEISIVGGLERAIKVWVDADRLAAYQIPITAVRDAIAQQNADAPGGNVTRGQQEQTLRTLGRFTDPKQFENLVIATINGSPVRVRDIGYAEDGTYEQRSLARLNGQPTVILEVRRQSGANTIEVIESAKQNMARVASQLPADVKLEVIRDQSRYIEAALHEINIHLILGSILACLVVLLFMRSWRSTLIAGVAIPASVISTFGMMWALDFTLNSVTMLALVLMVGIVIDDAIVVLENIFRFIEEKRMNAKEAAREATKEIGLAVLATTLSLVVIFLPVSFMSSISGRFLYQFGLTAAVAIMVSLLVSFTLTPMMSARLLKKEGQKKGDRGNAEAASRGGFYALLDRAYVWALRLALRRRIIVAALALCVIASSVFLYGQVRQEYIPSDVDEAEFELSVTAPQQASIAAMDGVMRVVENELRQTRGVRTVLTSAGGGFLANVNIGNAYVRIAPHEERVLSFTRVWNELKQGNPLGGFRDNYTQRDVMNEVRGRLRKYGDLRVSVRNLPSFNIGPGGNVDIDFSIRGPDLQALARYADTLRDRAPQLGLLDADTTLKLDDPELRVRIDRDRAADLGVSMADIATALSLMVGGEQEVSRFRDESLNENYDVQLRLIERDRDRADVISRLYVPRTNARNTPGAPTAPASTLVRLDNLVRIEQAEERAAHRPPRPAACVFLARRGRARLRARRPHRSPAR